MGNTYDIVVGGGGSNGLVAAAYMAKAGLNVCVLEYQPQVGGGLITKEVTVPGFKHDLASASHAIIQFTPLMTEDELELKSKYGLRYLMGDSPVTMIYPHKGTALTLYMDIDRTCQEIAKISEKDAYAYKEFYEFLHPAASMLVPGMCSPPAPLGGQMSLLESAGELGEELMRMMLMSAWDIIAERFESEEVRLMLTRFSSEWMISPFEAGTGSTATLMLELLHKIGMTIPEGGSYQLAAALVKCIEAHGGTIRTNATVKGVKIENGRAKAFVLADGEEVVGKKALLSTFHVKQLFGPKGMVESKNLPPGFEAKVQRIRPSSYSAINQHFALNEAPKFKALNNQPSPSILVEIASDADTYRRMFEDYGHGLPGYPEPCVVISTQLDPTRAPEGKHTLILYNYEPYNLYGDGKNWDKFGSKVADDILERLKSVTTNIDDQNILGRYVMTPLDLERYDPSWISGDFCHIAQSLDQLMANRPLLGWARYKTPIQGLYMGGASTHPGPCITGGGRAQSQVVLEDLGIDFDDVIRR